MPSKKKCLFIINPISGIGKQQNLPRLIEKHLDRGQFEYETKITEYAGHAVSIAAEAKDTFDILVAVGGDGTMNETASQLIGTNTTLGIIPLGSGNGFARSLEISTDPATAIRQFNRSTAYAIDTGYLNERPFFNVSGTGFDAQISKKFMTQIKRGFATYTRCVWEEFQQYEPRRYRFTLDGQTVEEPFFLIAFANTRQYGNNAVIAPRAQTNNGWLDIVFVRPFPVAYLPVFTALAFARNMHHSSYVKILRTKSFAIEQLDDPLVHIDGEYIASEPNIHLGVKAQSLLVMRP